MPKTVIAYLVWSNEPERYLTRALVGVSLQAEIKDNLHLLVIYNSHRSEEVSSLPFIHSEVAKMENQLPETTVIDTKKNLGFSGGNNVAMQWAIDRGYDYVFLHNADGYLGEGAIEKMVQAMEADKVIGQVQSLILLHSEKDKINTAGNVWQYFGIGYCGEANKEIKDFKPGAPYEIGYASGAATLMRTDLLQQFGLWNEDFFLYHEDSEYSWRLKFQGYKIFSVPEAVFYHEYEFSKNKTKYFWLERNRHVLNYLLYRWPTLILFLPLEIVYNLGLLLVAWRGRWGGELLKVYAYWLKPRHWSVWRKVKKQYYAKKVLSDRKILESSAKTVATGDLVVSGPVNKLANAIFTFYHFLLKILVWW